MSTGFWIARATADGTSRISGSEVLLSPAPVSVVYPDEPLGSRIETADGRLIVQQPAQDARVRSWVWRGYPGYMTAYVALWDLLEGTRSSLRKAQGLTPYTYLKDDVSGRFYKHTTYNGTVSAHTDTTVSVSGTPLTASAHIGHVIEIVSGAGMGQTRTVVSNTTSAFTVDAAWTTHPTDSTGTFVVRGRINDWFKVRVVGATRKVADGGGYVRYETTSLDFVVEDATWNQLG